LFLGAAELADEELFRALDKRHRIFGAQSGAAGTRPELPAILAAPTVRSIRPREAWPTTRSNAAELHLATLEQIAPPSVLTDERWNLIHLSPSAARFLQQSGGPQMRRITDCARPELRDELHALMTRAMGQPGPHVSGFIPVSFNGTPHQIAMLVEQRPTGQEGAAHLLVSFLDGGERPVDVVSGHSEPASDLVRELRERLRHAEQRIGMMRQEHHTTDEDLRAANEELQSLNEEYRSTTDARAAIAFARKWGTSRVSFGQLARARKISELHAR
jgi:two-component system CheB/CheR fusion protein